MGYRRQFELRLQVREAQEKIRECGFEDIHIQSDKGPAGWFRASDTPTSRVNRTPSGRHLLSIRSPKPLSKMDGINSMDACCSSPIGSPRQDRDTYGPNIENLRSVETASEWTPDEVYAWVCLSARLPEGVGEILHDEAVNGIVLLSLTEDDMEHMGIPKLGWRRQLSLCIDSLRQSTTITRLPPTVEEETDEETEGLALPTHHTYPLLSSTRALEPPSPKSAAAKILPTMSTRPDLPIVKSEGSRPPPRDTLMEIPKGTSSKKFVRDLLMKKSNSTEESEQDCQLYSLYDPFKMENEQAVNMSHGGDDESYEESDPEGCNYASVDSNSSEALMYAMLDPNQMTPKGKGLKSAKEVPVASERPVVSPTCSQHSEAEYWQDVTASRAANRRTSQISLELCSRRGIGPDGQDIDEIPEEAQAKAKRDKAQGLEFLPLSSGRAKK